MYHLVLVNIHKKGGYFTFVQGFLAISFENICPVSTGVIYKSSNAFRHSADYSQRWIREAPMSTSLILSAGYRSCRQLRYLTEPFLER